MSKREQLAAAVRELMLLELHIGQSLELLPNKTQARKERKLINKIFSLCGEPVLSNEEMEVLLTF